MMLFIVSTFASSASMKARSACDETPCDSGVARGSLLATGGSGATLGPDGCAATGAAIASGAARARMTAAARARDHTKPGRARRETMDIECRLLENRPVLSAGMWSDQQRAAAPSAPL